MEKLSRVAERVKSFSQSLMNDESIIAVIKEDHEPLKELIEVMKDLERPFSERFQAFQDFAPLLMTHAKAEERALYEFMKGHKDLREYAFEGDVEHSVADQLSEQAKRLTDEDQLSAEIKVLAENVEHHIKEEENTILPAVQKAVDEKVLNRLTEDYVRFQAELIADGQDDAPHEADLTKSDVAH